MSEHPQQGPGDPAPVVLGPPHPCPYLPGKSARFAYATRLPPGDNGFSSLLDHGFRRSGLFVYRTDCDGCNACRSLRIPVNEFRPDRAQRRALERNRDLDVMMGAPHFDAERADLFKKYLEARHDGQMSSDPVELEEGLYRSPVESIEITARHEGRLVVVGIVDVGSDLLSLVYSAYDPELRDRSLGTAFILWSIFLARTLEFRWVHLGYFVPGSTRMAYKTKFRPHELLSESGAWERAV